VDQRERVVVRDATDADLDAIIEIAKATGQAEDWRAGFPRYVRHLIEHGRFLVGGSDGHVAGFGATRRIGAGQHAICMLTDLFVDPAAHGAGVGRRILGALWASEPRKMTFSSLHANALPLYTSFGVDAWWPLLYFGGEVSRLARPAGWSVDKAEPAEIAALEMAWTATDRTADHELWAATPGGVSMIASLDGRPVAAGTAGDGGAEYGLIHMAMDRRDDADRHRLSAEAVITVLSSLEPADGRAHVCLPAPHPAVRPLLAVGWKVSEFDLYMASEPGFIDPLNTVPSPALA
jgi:GNAT superfamily N-acetyltransferase